MNVGDRVRVKRGVGKGHVGVITGMCDENVNLTSSAIKGLPGTQLIVPRAAVEVIGPDLPPRMATFRPYTPPRWSVPRAGSDLASRLPSVCGGQLVYPRGLQA